MFGAARRWCSVRHTGIHSVGGETFIDDYEPIKRYCFGKNHFLLVWDAKREHLFNKNKVLST